MHQDICSPLFLFLKICFSMLGQALFKYLSNCLFSQEAYTEHPIEIGIHPPHPTPLLIPLTLFYLFTFPKHLLFLAISMIYFLNISVVIVCLLSV